MIVRLNVWIILVAFAVTAGNSYANFPQTYEMYMQMGKEALNNKDYDNAVSYFKHADLVYPGTDSPQEYINLIKRLKDEQVVEINRPISAFSHKEIIYQESQNVFTPRPVMDGFEEPVLTNEKEYLAPVSKKYQKEALKDISSDKLPPVDDSENKENVYIKKVGKLGDEPETVYLDDRLWQGQPGSLIQVEFKGFRILEGSNIERFLIITPDFIEVERIDKDRIKISGLKRGSTFLHVWDDRGRWTFNVEVILPLSTVKAVSTKQTEETYVEPFSFSYSADWNSYYTGDRLPDIERDNVNFFQAVEMEGETPYGDVDGFVVFNKFDKENELSGYGGGLSNAQFAGFEDVAVKGGDMTKILSPLTVPGQYFRGGIAEAKHLNRNVEYTYFHGKDRAIFGFLAPGVLEERESFVEGAKLTVFPEKENQFSFNYARGYGEARESFLKDHVYSFQVQRRLKSILLNGEVAYDEDSLAEILHGQYQGKGYELNVSFRDIDKEYANITGLPSNRGETGGNISYNTKVRDAVVSSYLDLYQEHLNSNPTDPDAINTDFTSSVDIPINGTDSVRSSVYYIDTPGEISPRNNFRLNTTYNKQFKMTDFYRLNSFIGTTYQRSRFSLTPSSEYDRYSINSGFSVPVIKNLNYNANFEFSVVDEKESKDVLHPQVFNTGLSYTKKLTEKWSMNSALTYRNEENTEGNNSFLAGEDSLTGSMGATYRPKDDFEFFIDGRVRNVWAENANSDAYNEVDIRSGVRTSWDTVLFWNPKGSIAGFVYKDFNNNQRKDKDEEGIAGVTVKVGKSEAKTNEHGYYETEVKAKSASVSVDVNTVPKGFIFSTPSIVDKEIIHNRTQRVDFGLTTESGIYGVVFYDVNDNNQPDKDDEFIGKAKLTLDGKLTAQADFEGAYFFKNVAKGEHTISVDVNSLPIEYIPKIKIINKVKVEEGSTYVFHIPLTKTQK